MVFTESHLRIEANFKVERRPQDSGTGQMTPDRGGLTASLKIRFALVHMLPT